MYAHSSEVRVSLTISTFHLRTNLFKFSIATFTQALILKKLVKKFFLFLNRPCHVIFYLQFFFSSFVTLQLSTSSCLPPVVYLQLSPYSCLPPGVALQFNICLPPVVYLHLSPSSCLPPVVSLQLFPSSCLPPVVDLQLSTSS